MKASDSLRAARARIERPEAWCKGVWGGKSCVLNALPFADPAARYLHEAAVEMWPARARGPMTEAANFNDDKATDHADVLALYDRAIAMAEKDEAEP